MDGISAGVTAATKAATGYQKGKLQAAILGRQLEEDQQDRQMRSEDFGVRMHNAGYVPTSSATEAPPIKTGQLLAAISGGGATAAGPIAAPLGLETPKRYGDTVGRFTYDNASPAAQMTRSRVDMETASADRMKALAGRTSAMTPNAGMRDALIRAGNEPEDVDAVLATGDPAAVRGLLRPNSVDTHAAKRDYDIAHPLPARAGAGRANAEPPAHRDARQGISAVNGQIQDDRDQIKAMDRTAPPLVQYPGIATGTAADSAQARDFTQRRSSIQQHADSLRGVRDQLAGQLTGGPRASAGAPAPTVPNASTGNGAGAPPPSGPAGQLATEAQNYQAAQGKIRQTFSGNPAEMTRRLTAAKAIYMQRVRGLRGGSQ